MVENFEQFMNQQMASCLSFKSVNEETETHMQSSMVIDKRQPDEEVGDPLLVLLAQDHGNAYEQIDPYTLEIISKILPNSGIKFLSCILQHATVIQNVLPNLEALGERVAVINTRTIRLLAKAIQWGYDTTHKYVSVFMSLGLLYRYKHKTGNMLVFPLKVFVLPDNLHALDTLITQSRPKVRQFARKVKERLFLYKLVHESVQRTESLVGPSEGDISLHHLLLVSMAEIMKAEGVEEKQGTHIALRLMKEVIAKFVFSGQNISSQLTTQMKGRSESSFVAQTSVPQQQISVNNNNTIEQYRAQLPFQDKKRNKSSRVPATRVSGARKKGRPVQAQVSYVEAFTSKVDSLQPLLPSTTQEKLVQREVSDTAIEKSTLEKSTLEVDSLQTSHSSIRKEGFTQRDSAYAIAEKSALEVDSLNEGHIVSYENDKNSVVQSQEMVDPEVDYITYLPVKEMNSINDILDFYDEMLESEKIDWRKMPLPKEFFELIYAQLNAHYQRLYTNGFISRLKQYMWRSTEISIIKRVANQYEVNNENACLYIFNLSGREYKSNRELQRSSATAARGSDESPIEKDLDAKNKAEDDFLRNRSKEVGAEQEKYQYEKDRNYDKSTQSTKLSDHEVDRNYDKSTSKISTRKTSGTTEVVDTYQESPYPQLNESSCQGFTQLYDEDTAEASLESIGSYQNEGFMAMYPPEIKPLRIPAEVDSEDYLEAFYYVLRNRNINILFNNIYKNDTLRNSAAQFLTAVFDKDNSKNNINVNKQNEKLLAKYKPEVIMRGFIDTILTMHEPGYDSLQNPGAFFTSRCKFYNQNKPDVETDELINRFAGMSYHLFANEMHTLINSGQKIRTKQYKKRF